MKPGGIVGALAAAAIGAIAWALVAKFTGYEVGYVAWGVGALIGFTSALLGGKGVTNGVVCAVLALAAIASGKVLGSMWTTEQNAREAFAEEMLSQESYNMMMAESQEFAAISDETDYPKFLVDNGYYELTSVEEVTPGHIAQFKEQTAERLRQMAQTDPTYEQWKESETPHAMEVVDAYAKEEAALWTIGDHIAWSKDNLAAMDILFAVLGIASAFALGKGKEEEPAV
jgi:hypothetical protein